MKKSILSHNWPFMIMLVVIVLVFGTTFVASAQTPGGESTFRVIYATDVNTFEGHGTLQQLDVDIDGVVVQRADIAYGTRYVIDAVRTKDGHATLNVVIEDGKFVDHEIHIYKDMVSGPPVRRLIAPSAMALAVEGGSILLPRSSYIVRLERTVKGQRTSDVGMTTEIPQSSVTVTGDRLVVSYGRLDRRIVVNGINPSGKLVQVNEFEDTTFTGQVLAMSVAGDDLFVLGYHPGDSVCSLWMFPRISSGASEAVSLSSVGIPVNPANGTGNILSAVYSADGTLGVFMLNNSESEGSIMYLFKPGSDLIKVTSDAGSKFTAIRAFPAPMP